jgi:hypothetical protein
VSCLLLAVGFAVAVAGFYLLAVAGAGSDATLAEPRQALTLTYFRVVFVKGLLPQLLLALALWPLLVRVRPRFDASRSARLLGLSLAAALAYAVVAPLLLTVEFPGWPAFQLRSLYHHLGTATLNTAAVVAAASIGRLLVFRGADAR